jgi:AGCS family alanine or glycine:cation symporter
MLELIVKSKVNPSRVFSLESLLMCVDQFLWNFVGLTLILTVGIYLSYKSKFFQFKVLLNFRQYIKDLINCDGRDRNGVHPIKLYFASIGGTIGLGNIVAIASTVTLGGPGSLIWIWIASILGMLVKYSEIYLGIKYRVKNSNNSFDGGPMYYLKAAFTNRHIPVVVCLFLCLYGAEIFQFNVLTTTLQKTFGIQKYTALILLLITVLLSSFKGVKRLADICALLMPPFMVTYMILGVVIIFDHAAILPSTLKLILNSFWGAKSQIGGVASGSFLVTAHYGLSRAVYSGDIGIGYDSIIQSETQSRHPEKQARMAVFSLFTDTTICTISLLILLVTGVWQQDIASDDYIKTAFAMYLPKSCADYFVAFLFISAGFTTIVGYLVVGQKCAQFINARYGKQVYTVYAALAFTVFSFCSQDLVLTIMSISGGLLMSINIIGLVKLRKHIKFL